MAKKVKSTFKKEEWLTSQQVASYFSRLAALQKSSGLTSEVDEEVGEMDILVDQMNNRRRIREKIAPWGTVGYLSRRRETGHLTDELESIQFECTRFCEAPF